MSIKVFSCLVKGLQASLIEVEADILPGLSAFKIVGLGDTSVQEAKERVRSAIRNTKAKYPREKKVINLAPASLKKHGPSFDLAMAISLLTASKQIDEKSLKKSLLIGELALDGTLKPVKNILTITLFAQQNQWKRIFIPSENYYEATLIYHNQENHNQNKGRFNNLQIIPIQSLQELLNYLKNEKQQAKKQQPQQPAFKTNFDFIKQQIPNKQKSEVPSYLLIQGQESAKRALQISAAGGHHLLLSGPPGIGKTMLAKSLIDLLPNLTQKQFLEKVQIYSAVSIHQNSIDEYFNQSRPFRQAHHNTTLKALIGGGSQIQPGEITLAHHGTLFLDEIAEFPRAHLEALRQPLEEKQIHISNFYEKAVLPANFTLIAAFNPCPCGYFSDLEKKCICSASSINRYQKKLSGPIFDRFDLAIKLNRPKINFQKLIQKKYISEESLKSFQELKNKVKQAHHIQRKRFETTTIQKNAELNTKNIWKYLDLTSSAEEYLNLINQKTSISARSYLHLLKVALTIADLENQSQVSNFHLAEAFQYRQELFQKL